MPKKLEHRDRYLNVYYQDKRARGGRVLGNEIQVRVKRKNLVRLSAEPPLTWEYRQTLKVADDADFVDPSMWPAAQQFAGGAAQDGFYNYRTFRIPPPGGVTYALTAQYRNSKDVVAVKHFTTWQRVYLDVTVKLKDAKEDDAAYPRLEEALRMVKAAFALAYIDVVPSKLVKGKTVVQADQDPEKHCLTHVEFQLLAQKLRQDAGAKDVYLCGPPGMIDAALRAASEAGVPHEQIYFERFLPSG